MSPTPVPDDAHSLVALLDLLARRGAAGAVWELRAGAQSFRVLAQRSPLGDGGLSQRLRELRDAGLVEVDEAGDYRLTSHGRRLLGVLEPLAVYAQNWAALTPRQRRPRGSADAGRGEPGDPGTW